MHDELVADIDERLRALRPSSILLLGADGRALLEPYLQSHPRCDLRVADWGGRDDDAPALERLAGDGRYDLGLVCWMHPGAPPAGAAHVIARLRDLHARRLWVLATLGQSSSTSEGIWTPADLVALGLSHARAYAESCPPLHLYSFDLASYKTTPPWLSPEHWAHPERWDKDRW